MSSQVFFEQKAESIRESGYVSFSNPEFAKEFMDWLPRPEFSKIRYVGGCGRFAVEGYIYLPRAKAKIIRIIRSQLEEVERYADSYREALNQMKNP